MNLDSLLNLEKEQINMRILYIFAIIIAYTLVFQSCTKIDNPTPTNELMEGVWEVSEVIDANGIDITDTIIGLFPAYLHLDDANSVNSTAGPLFMYLVYGKSRIINISSKLDEVFKYTDMQLTEGEWFIDKNKVVDNFTLEIKMRFPSLETFNEIFEIFNINPPEIVADAIDIIVYHKFKFIKTNIDELDSQRMTWTISEEVEANYYTKDQYGDRVVYLGINPNSFSHCTITWAKKASPLTQLVQNAYGK